MLFSCTVRHFFGNTRGPIGVGASGRKGLFLERQKFEKLALEHLDAVYRMSFHLTRNPDEAQDLVQEVYVRAMRPKTIERFEESAGTGGMRSWLFAICHNQFYTKLKKDARRPTSVEEFYTASETERAPEDAPPAYDRRELDWDHVDGRLKAAIDELKDEYREVLLMWGVDGLKYREIATIMDVPIGTIMSRLHRARKLLADKLLADTEAASDLGIGVRGSGTNNNGDES
jgi:RNA polymerase sigma-70 factor, ECF subfamily